MTTHNLSNYDGDRDSKAIYTSGFLVTIVRADESKLEAESIQDLVQQSFLYLLIHNIIKGSTPSLLLSTFL